MWLFPKRWRGWAMNKLQSLLRSGPQSQSLHVSYEKAGLILHDPAIPWNADAVLVEAALKLDRSARRKADFSLRMPERSPIPAENLRPEDGGERFRVFFRLATPERSVEAELFYKERRLGVVPLPIMSMSEFTDGLRIDMPTVLVRVGNQNVPCQTVVASQCKGWQGCAVVVSRSGSLAPLGDLGLNVQFRSERDGTSIDAPVALSGTQLQGRQALISASPRNLPRRMGAWTVTWRVGERVYASQRVKAISQRTFQRSLRISDTRFVTVDKQNKLTVRRQLPPISEITRIGPCFLISSREAGMAGLCTLQVHAQIPGGMQSPLLLEQELLVTDGPTMFAPGTVDVADLEQVTAFDLRLRGASLGMLPLSPVPAATFNSEGGFRPPPEFLWTSAADEELTERLNRLMGNGRG
jgi:hypothetical protein